MAVLLEPVADAPAGFTDYVARFTHPRRDMRAQVFRAPDEAQALRLALDTLDAQSATGWVLLDLVTMEEAIARRGGRR